MIIMPEYCLVNMKKARRFEFKDMPYEYLKRVPMRYNEARSSDIVVHDGALYDMIGKMTLRLFPSLKN